MRPEITPLLNKTKKRANKELSHLTYTRIHINPEEKKWYFGKIHKDISLAFDVFIENIDKGLLNTDWDNFIQKRGNYIKHD